MPTSAGLTGPRHPHLGTGGSPDEANAYQQAYGKGTHPVPKWRPVVATSLIVLGVALIAVALLVRLVGCVIKIAIPIGLVLIVIGVIWRLSGG